MRAQDVLIKTNTIVKELTQANITEPHSIIRSRVRELDSLNLAITAELGQFQAIHITEGPDAAAAQSLRLNALFLIHM